MGVLQRSDFGGGFTITATVDPGNHTAVASVDTTVTHADVLSGDSIIPVPPAALEAGITVVGCHTVADGSFKLRTTNASAGAINPASATWTFLVFRK